MDYQIIRTRKDGPDHDRRIDAVQLADGRILLLDEAIRWIDTLGHRFWCHDGVNSVLVDVRQRGLLGAKYLTTEADGYPRNNLLHLANC